MCQQASIRYLIRIVIAMTLPAVSVGAQTVRFAAFGDYGVNNANEQAVANLVESWAVDFIVTTGDNSYGSTSIDLNIGKYYAPYIGAYVGSFGPGADTNKFFPSLGNHDYSDGAGIAAYLGYFDLPGAGVTSTYSSGNERYYDFRAGPVHFFAVNSNAQEPDGINAVSQQGFWLQSQLALSDAPWKIVYMHNPPYSSSSRHGSEVVMQWPYEDWGATAVLAGHDHTYERIMRDDNADGDTMAYFVTGLGGRSPYLFPSSGFVDGSTVRYNTTNGSMLIEADSLQIRFYFYSVAFGSTLVDSLFIGECCRGMRGDINGDGTDLDPIDMAALIDHLFGGPNGIGCPAEADIDADGLAATPLDLGYLVDHLYGDLELAAACP